MNLTNPGTLSPCAFPPIPEFASRHSQIIRRGPNSLALQIRHIDVPVLSLTGHKSTGDASDFRFDLWR